MLNKKFKKIRDYNIEIFNQTYLDSIQVKDTKLIEKLLSKYFNLYIIKLFKSNEEILSNVDGYYLDEEFDYYSNNLNKNYFKKNLLVSLIFCNIAMFFISYSNILNMPNLYVYYSKFIILIASIIYLFVKTYIDNRNKKFNKNYEFLKIISKYTLFDEISKDSYFTEEEINILYKIRDSIEEVKTEVYEKSREYRKSVQKYIEESNNYEKITMNADDFLNYKNSNIKHIFALSKNNILETERGQKFLTEPEELAIAYLDSYSRPIYFEIISVDNNIDKNEVIIQSKIIDNYLVNTTVSMNKDTFLKLLDLDNVYIQRSFKTRDLIQKYSK